ncbi:hypothetical protein [Aestuariivirga sp.]|uniref:hypothetical protein n=1 Tax=Aestuariivirga sp. TaxID=2650926 RepID=UPI0039E3F166
MTTEEMAALLADLQVKCELYETILLAMMLNLAPETEDADRATMRVIQTVTEQFAEEMQFLPSQRRVEAEKRMRALKSFTEKLLVSIPIGQSH